MEDEIGPFFHGIILLAQNFLVAGQIIHGFGDQNAGVTPSGNTDTSFETARQSKQQPHALICLIVGNHHGHMSVFSLISTDAPQPSGQEARHILVLQRCPGINADITCPSCFFSLWTVGGNRNHVGSL